MSILAKITEIIPDVEYEGTVYEQRVVVELSNGNQIGLFDYDMHTSPEMIGKKKFMSVFAYIPREVEIRDDTESGIKPSTIDPTDWKYHTYCGMVESIGSDGTIVIDVGYGTVQVDATVQELVEIPIKVGQTICAQTNRSDLVDINDLDGCEDSQEVSS